MPGRATDGIRGASLSVTGLPAQVVATVTPNPAAVSVSGDPLNLGGDIAFAECQSMPVVVLYTIRLVPVGDVPASRLRVQKPQVPVPALWCWPGFPFNLPYVNLCDSPVFTVVCLEGGEAFLNDPGNECNVAVEETSWSTVKGLFN